MNPELPELRDTPECADCQASAGVYWMTCIGCYARLVVSARPNRRQQEAMLGAIARSAGAPTREAVLERMASTTNP